ncbi:hypothetical protein [Porphyrobacter sp. CACIAM 03H1]|jgi:hypothetical protein|uniref:hypothetical protein n=1 Tax=Porphyrobacter sp. CACIAM 03H1 TaxID=2003315 RepID=UPI000B5A323A|nr:hypothetical protein [Porphyrobacter sp. CACIAM 03H1]ASJ90544.1 hypothetical protein CBR61_06165 [Porphyrobacter sp. CACIAM 03H1]
MSVAGTYKTVVKSPMGDQTGTLTVNPDGDTFTGSLVGSLGSMDINDGTVEGNTIKWKMNMVVPMPMTLDCEATIDGDTLTGSVNAGAFGAMPLSGTREA